MTYRFALSACWLILIANAATAQTISVTSSADSGPGSLREAVAIANSDTDQDTVLIDASVAIISLASGQLEVTESLIIIGPESMTTIYAQSS